MTTTEMILQKFSDLLRPNRYNVEFFPPQKLKTLYSDISKYNRVMDLFKYLTISTVFPFETLQFSEVEYNGRKYSIANIQDFDPIDMTFNLDSEGLILDFFQKWKSLIVDDLNRVGYFDDYVGEVVVKMFDRQNNNIFQVTLMEAYPANRTNIPLGSQLENSFTEFTVGFRFTKSKFAVAGQSYIDKSVEKQPIKDYGKIISESFSFGEFNGNDFFKFDPFGSSVNNTLQNWNNQLTEALDRLRLDALSKVKIPSIGIINTNFQSLVNTQYNQIGKDLLAPIQTKVSAIQSSITKKYQEIQQQTVQRLTSSITKSINKIFKF